MPVGNHSVRVPPNTRLSLLTVPSISEPTKTNRVPSCPFTALRVIPRSTATSSRLECSDCLQLIPPNAFNVDMEDSTHGSETDKTKSYESAPNLWLTQPAGSGPDRCRVVPETMPLSSSLPPFCPCRRPDSRVLVAIPSAAPGLPKRPRLAPARGEQD